jgi:hypothetical protein
MILRCLNPGSRPKHINDNNNSSRLEQISLRYHRSATGLLLSISA